MFSEDFSPEERQKLELAVKIAQSFFPYLGGIFTKLDIRFDYRIDTAAVTPFGKLLFNPVFFDHLAPGLETAFVVAHELLHLAQGFFERTGNFKDKEPLNIAHDILINELLCDTMNLPEPPCNGLSWKWFLEVSDHEWYTKLSHPIPGIPNPAEKASAYSLEQLVRIIISVEDTGSHPGNEAWGGKRGGTAKPGDVLTGNPFADAFDNGSPEKPGSARVRRGTITLDILDEETEKKLFPDEDESERRQTRNELEKVLHKSLLQKIVLSSADERILGTDPGNIQCDDVEVIKSTYSPPWEMAMQRWFDGAAVSKRSWARPSRRGAWRTDVVLPSRSRDFLTLHIILDTSGSMARDIPGILGQISAFARNVGIGQVHVIQCDADVQQDEFIEVDQLERYQVTGYGGSDLSPAMMKLAEDPDVTSVLIITDGDIEYPPNEDDIPYDVLWCIPECWSWSKNFSAPYGKIIFVPVGEGE